ncbi:hypothetical protein [Alkalihalobacillus sp. BA299]|uniref:hypothetical protein n=1 Tax=Alkalihalobacillus sp. BA299 TaxID=2815938 RepID=UPI001ADAA77A|nr:hypothetical protein [Alkalihalobacillus sp. BA299]
MNFSHMMVANVSQLQQTLRINILKSSMATQAAFAVNMLDEVSSNQLPKRHQPLTQL